MKIRKIRTAILSAVLAAVMLLAGIVPALGENRLESAPEVRLPAAEEVKETGAAVPYLPYARTLPDRGDEGIPLSAQYELPRLTDEELGRARTLMADLEAGKQPVWNDIDYVNKTENVTVGVYPLDPRDFDGETFYVILPPARLSDDMLLSLISAFDRLGIPFDPDALNERNCFRDSVNGGKNRGFSYEEKERLDTIRYQTSRGMIGPQKIPADTFCLYADLAWAGRDAEKAETYRFCICPYRSMTDQELAAYAIAMEGEWGIDPDQIEAQALALVRGHLKAPLALTPENAVMYRKADGTLMYDIGFAVPYADEITGLRLYPNGKPSDYSVRLIQKPGADRAEMSFIRIDYYMSPETDPDRWPAYSEADWVAEARKWAAETLRLPEEELPADWVLALDSGEYGYVSLTAQTKELQIVLTRNKWDAGSYACYLGPKD